MARPIPACSHRCAALGLGALRSTRIPRSSTRLRSVRFSSRALSTNTKAAEQDGCWQRLVVDLSRIRSFLARRDQSRSVRRRKRPLAEHLPSASRARWFDPGFLLMPAHSVSKPVRWSHHLAALAFPPSYFQRLFEIGDLCFERQNPPNKNLELTILGGLVVRWWTGFEWWIHGIESWGFETDGRSSLAFA